jgi:hypothetical protein
MLQAAGHDVRCIGQRRKRCGDDVCRARQKKHSGKNRTQGMIDTCIAADQRSRPEIFSRLQFKSEKAPGFKFCRALFKEFLCIKTVGLSG